MHTLMRVSARARTHARARAHTHTHTLIYTQTHAHIHTRTFTHTHIHIRTHTHTHTFSHIRIHTHLLSATVRVYSLFAPCRLPDLTSLALLGSVSGQRRLSRGPLPGYKTVSKWRLQLQDSTPFPLLSQSFRTTLHTSATLGCYLLFTLMPDCPLTPLGQV